MLREARENGADTSRDGSRVSENADMVEAEHPRGRDVPAAEPLSRLDWLWKTSGVAANFTVAITVAIAVLTYSADREAVRVAAIEQQEREARTAALSYVTRFQTGEVLDARNEIYAAFLDLGPEQIPELGLTDEVRTALIEAMIVSRPEPLAMRLALVNIIDFYDGVEACRGAQLCDPSILDASLASYGVRFQCFFEGFVDQTRTSLRVPEMGRGLVALVERAGGCR